MLPTVVLIWGQAGLSAQEFRDLESQGLSELGDVVDGDVPLLSFDFADVGPVEAGALRKLLLGESLRQALPTQVLCEEASSDQPGLLLGHEDMLGGLTSLVP